MQPPTTTANPVTGRRNVGFTRTCPAAAAAATDSHGSPSTGRRRVVRHRQRERHQVAGVVTERLQVSVHGDEEEISADQRSKRVRRGVVLVVERGRFKFLCHTITYGRSLFVQASEEAIVKLRNSAAVAADHLQQKQQSQHHHHQIYYVVNQILYPVVQGCETKDPKIVKVHIVIISVSVQIVFVINLPTRMFLAAL